MSLFRWSNDTNADYYIIRAILEDEESLLNDIPPNYINTPIFFDNRYLTPLDIACAHSNAAMVRFLIHHGASIEHLKQPFHIAAIGNKLDIVQLLSRYGSTSLLTSYDKYNYPIIILAAAYRAVDVVEFLKSHYSENMQLVVDYILASRIWQTDLETALRLLKTTKDANLYEISFHYIDLYLANNPNLGRIYKSAFYDLCDHYMACGNEEHYMKLCLYVLRHLTWDHADICETILMIYGDRKMSSNNFISLVCNHMITKGYHIRSLYDFMLSLNDKDTITLIFKRTPLMLHFLCTYDSPEISPLLEYCSNLDVLDFKTGNTALHIVRNPQLKDLLVKCGAHPDYSNREGNIPEGISHINLKCMAARTIKLYDVRYITYKDKLPKKLVEFIENHDGPEFTDSLYYSM